MFIDKVKIYVKAGNGGNGCVSFRREKYVSHGGPDGGDGGKGGDVVFVPDEGENTLLDFKYRRKFVAPNGADGGNHRFHGKNAEDVTIPVPPGTVIKDAETDDAAALPAEPDAASKTPEADVMAVIKDECCSRNCATDARRGVSMLKHTDMSARSEV